MKKKWQQQDDKEALQFHFNQTHQITSDCLSLKKNLFGIGSQTCSQGGNQRAWESQQYSISQEASNGLRKSFSMLVDGLLRKAIIRSGHGWKQ